MEERYRDDVARGGWTDFAACLLRRALILAVQGLMMLSEGETYLSDLRFRFIGQHRIPLCRQANPP